MSSLPRSHPAAEQQAPKRTVMLTSPVIQWQRDPIPRPSPITTHSTSSLTLVATPQPPVQLHRQAPIQTDKAHTYEENVRHQDQSSPFIMPHPSRSETTVEQRAATHGAPETRRALSLINQRHETSFRRDAAGTSTENSTQQQPPLAWDDDRRALIQSDIPSEKPMPYYVLLPIGKTGDGKSSLLNLLFGYPEFKAKKSVQSITSKVTERTFVWTFNNNDSLITAADTPGFADSAGRDDEFHTAIKEYIKDVGARLGIDAFLLVFRYNSKFVMNILQKFVDMMSDLSPGWWDHVILVFTAVDYSPNQKQEVSTGKWRLKNDMAVEIQKKYNLRHPPQVLFTSAKTPTCALQTGTGNGVCDCKAALQHRNNQLLALKKALAEKSREGRWIYSP